MIVEREALPIEREALVADIAAKLVSIRARIDSALLRSKRELGSTALLAVSKRHTVSSIRAAYEAGQRLFGENYVQELVAKTEELSDLVDLDWHFIGRFQRNKAGALIKAGARVQTVDSSRLSDALGRRAVSAGVCPGVFLQVNIGAEPQKSGCAIEDVAQLAAKIRSTPGLELEGLMAIAPASADPEDSRPYYRELKRLADQVGVTELSMGMSGDFEVAIEEGATLVRVGTSIFGSRPDV